MTITPERGEAFSPARCWVLTWGCTISCHRSICGGAGWGWWSSEPLLSLSYEILCLGSRSSQPCCCSGSVSSWCCWSEDGYLSTSGQKIYQFDIPAIKAWYANWNRFHTSHYSLVFNKVSPGVEQQDMFRQMEILCFFFAAQGILFPFFLLFFFSPLATLESRSNISLALILCHNNFCTSMLLSIVSEQWQLQDTICRNFFVVGQTDKRGVKDEKEQHTSSEEWWIPLIMAMPFEGGGCKFNKWILLFATKCSGTHFQNTLQ